jgi:hypothetical protein
MNEDDRKTDPDPRSPYECILDELITIRKLCTATNQWQAVTMMASAAAFVMASCTFVR